MAVNGIGRPSLEYDPNIGREICRAISISGKSLASLCKANPHWPQRTTIFEWRLDYPHFADLYTKARQTQVEAFIDDVTDIADNSTPEYAQVTRTRIDTRKWIACKLAPKIYGDKIHHTADIKMTHEEQLKELE